MAFYEPWIIVCGSSESLEAVDLRLPVSFSLAFDVDSLDRRINAETKLTDPSLKRFFVLLIDSIDQDAEYWLTALENNSRVVTIFICSNDDSSSSIFQQNKHRYIAEKFIPQELTFNIRRFLQNEAKKIESDQPSLAHMYSQRAEKLQDWLMTSMQAESCHILLIPLNTNYKNVYNAQQSLRESCVQLGYKSTEIRLLSDYIPTNETYSALPYGKFLFEYEDPIIICRFIRQLSPIRMYLYGNEEIIPSEWSKLMIANEKDSDRGGLYNDDDWHTFVEYESIDDDIKWNFSAIHGQTWKVKNLVPIKLHSIKNNIRFPSALLRAHSTFIKRMIDVTSQIFDWYDHCIQGGYIKREVKSRKRNKIESKNDQKRPRVDDLPKSKPPSINRFALDFDPINDAEKKQPLSMIPSYDKTQYNQTDLNMDYIRNSSGRTFIWLDGYDNEIDERFNALTSPDHWILFRDVSECVKFIQRQQLQYDTKIFLIATHLYAQRIFNFLHLSQIYAAYLICRDDQWDRTWTRAYPVIRAIHKDTDTLWRQVRQDIARMALGQNLSPVPTSTVDIEEQKSITTIPISFLDTDRMAFLRHRLGIQILLRLPRSSEAKQEMLDECRRQLANNSQALKEIDEFELNYHANAAIQWYTREACFYRLINEALRSQDMTAIQKFRFLIVDLYTQLDELHKQILHSGYRLQQSILTYYRGQRMSLLEIEKFKQNLGGLVSTNTFLSTTSSSAIALMFAGNGFRDGVTAEQSTLFRIDVDPRIENTQPFANVNFYSAFEQEDEVIFALGTVFRIEKVEWQRNENFWLIQFELVDEKILPVEQITLDFARLVPEQKIHDPEYVLIGLDSLFERNEQVQRIKILLNDYIKFFRTTEQFEDYTRSMQTIRPLVIFINTNLDMPNRGQQTKIISFAENEIHINDLVYELLHEMNIYKISNEKIDELCGKVAAIYRPSEDQMSFVQLLLQSSVSKRDREEYLKIHFFSSLITFYQLHSCVYYLQSIVQPKKAPKIILLLQADETNMDEIIRQFDPIDSIKYIYICSRTSINVDDRRIRGIYRDENAFYTQIFSDNIYLSFKQANEQFNRYHNESKALANFDRIEEFYELIHEQLNSPKLNRNTVE